ncbi:M14-type cytosolic carboxypeptidase [uncultured Sphingomonas sp.]|uniref:M14 family metallopeptidase n=1 Tax=unclassified Sphingomonas TaxID=196159 RepID=UPI0025E36A3E|nr:M14-type cytosolic carboxypeptidase [uncultured Sphingomonas sp.]
MSLSINAAFDSGNIRLVAIDGDRVDLEIVKDHQSDFFQWFYFRVAGLGDAVGANAGGPRRLTFRILNAAQSAYPFGWPGYRTRVSTDRREWRMIETRYVDGVLEFDWSGDAPIAWFAYFAPYTMEQHADLVARIAARPGVTHRELGTTLDGQAIDYFRLGSGPKQVWLYARQHPGESMAEYWMDGALDWLTSPAAAALLEAATVHVVPNMNPDGTRRGHLRTNAAGVNLNREWHAPSLDRSPEVFHVLAAMDESGVDFAMDVHGDEAIPANFIAGFEGIPSLTPRQSEAFLQFGQRLAAHTPDFQTKLGYDVAQPGRANLSMSTNQVAERFGAVSVTLEMPFKDHDPNPDPVHGWSPERSAKLGVACLEVITGMIGEV